MQRSTKYGLVKNVEASPLLSYVQQVLRSIQLVGWSSKSFPMRQPDPGGRRIRGGRVATSGAQMHFAHVEFEFSLALPCLIESWGILKNQSNGPRPTHGNGIAGIIEAQMKPLVEKPSGGGTEGPQAAGIRVGASSQRPRLLKRNISRPSNSLLLKVWCTCLRANCRLTFPTYPYHHSRPHLPHNRLPPCTGLVPPAIFAPCTFLTTKQFASRSYHLPPSHDLICSPSYLSSRIPESI